MSNRISEFDLWKPGYGGSIVSILIAGTTGLAAVYEDIDLTIPAANPQTLLSMISEGGVRYGKFAKPLYTDQSYYTSIDGIENTGIVRSSISSLKDEDASKATVIPKSSTYAVTLQDLAARQVNVANFGTFVEGTGGVAADNTQTLSLAVASLLEGGFVNIPAGLYKLNNLELPENVVLRGQGDDATILQSILGAESFTLVGDGAGFADLTLDGNSLLSNSVAVRDENINRITFDNVKIKRFETGIYLSGGNDHTWNNFSIENTVNAAKIYGEDAVLQDVLWIGGKISVATTVGLSLSYENNICQNIILIGVSFDNCTNNSFLINGAQNVQFIGCSWDGNTKIGKIQDDTDLLTPATSKNNDVISVQFIGGRMKGGSFEATNTCENVVLKNVTLETVEFKMTTPLDNFIVLQDCYENTGVTITGEAAKLLRSTTSLDGSSFGLTTTASATKAWGLQLAPGQQAYLEAKVIGKGRNGLHLAIYHIGCGVYRPGSTLAYDTQTANFTAGATLTGQSSGAKARIQFDSDSGTTGTLTLTDILGSFLDNEIITDDSGTPGSAMVNGTLTSQNATLDAIGNVNLRAVFESNAAFLAAFVANGTEIELQVTGAAASTIEWTVNVDVVST
jgi:hypothetical protein